MSTRIIEKEYKEAYQRKYEMEEFIKNFKGMPDRLLKYCEILLERENASPYSYQNTMSFRRLAIELTTYCNLNCIWCFRHDQNFKHMLNKELPYEKLKAIISNAKSKFRMVHLGGLGEPLLYSKLYEAIELSKKIANQIKITTNGTLSTKEKIDEMTKRGLTHIEISIDAFDSRENYKLRGSDLNKLVESIRYINDKGLLHIQINSVVANINYDSLKNVVEILKECKNIRLLRFIPLFTAEQLRSSGIKRISDEEFKALLSKIQNDIERYHLQWKLSPSPYGVKMDPVIEMKKKLNICFSCFEDPYISVKGELLPCGRQQIYGGVDASNGFEKAWNHPKLLEYRKNMLIGRYPELCSKLCYLK